MNLKYDKVLRFHTILIFIVIEAVLNTFISNVKGVSNCLTKLSAVPVAF